MNEKNRTKIVLVVLCTAAALVIGVMACVLVSGKMKAQKYQEQIGNAQKYLSQGEYDKAEKLLKEAISLRPDEVDAYLELADVYVEQAETSKAMSILRKGYDVTGSVKIKRYMSKLEAEQKMVLNGVGSKGAENGTPIDLETASKDLTWDTSFLQKLISYTFADYKAFYGFSPAITKDEDGYLEVEHPDLDMVCYYRNTSENKEIVDESRKTPLSSGMPEKVTLKSMELLFRNFDGAVSLERMQMLLGEKVQPKTSAGRTYLERKTEDYIIRIETDENGNVVSANAWNEIVLPNANVKKNKTGQIQGVVVDAVSGDGVNGARLNFEPIGAEGKAVQAGTNSAGVFSLELEPGKYAVMITADKYIAEEFSLEIEEEKNYNGLQFTLSPDLETGTARIVLEWNAQPRDLDSHLTGRTDSGTTIHTYYGSQQAVSGGNTIAELDLDDTSGYGPETTTIYDLNGVYTFTVVDFLETGTMKENGATVKIYLPGQPVQTITLNAGSNVVDVWEVCTIDHGQVRVVNGAPSGEDFAEGNK